ncbi:MAG: hypothetical protein GC137_00615 [Alphaproteobacteria bacterium]|nr:hypothetical protein [Alphaproteobacteria bacterium]
MDKITRAKELYIKYKGDSRAMWEDHVLDEYDSLGATEEEEVSWHNELSKNFLSKLSRPIVINEAYYELKSTGFRNYTTFLEYLDIIDQDKHYFDTFAAVMLAEELMDCGGEYSPIEPYTYSMRKGYEDAEKILNLAQSVLEIAENSPFSLDEHYLSEEYRNRPGGIEHLEEDVLMPRIRKNLEKIKNALKNKYTGKLGEVVHGPWGDNKKN